MLCSTEVCLNPLCTLITVVQNWMMRVAYSRMTICACPGLTMRCRILFWNMTKQRSPISKPEIIMITNFIIIYELFRINWLVISTLQWAAQKHLTTTQMRMVEAVQPIKQLDALMTNITHLYARPDVIVPKHTWNTVIARLSGAMMHIRMTR